MSAPLFDILERRKSKFILWIPGQPSGTNPPQLVLGILDITSSPFTFNQLFRGPFVNSDKPDLFELDPDTITPALQDGSVYWYWFEVNDRSSSTPSTVLVTDPMAYTVDYSMIPSRNDGVQPTAVIKFRGGKMWPCDTDGQEPATVAVPAQTAIPNNSNLVIYELHVSWAKGTEVGNVQVDVGTLTDVLALFDVNTAGDHFKDMPGMAGSAIFTELGINALEILPVADAKSKGQWGYATADYFAPDYDVGTS
jgi:pullulanase